MRPGEPRRRRLQRFERKTNRWLEALTPWGKIFILCQNEDFVTENRILRSKLNGRPQLKDEERRQLAIIGKQLGRKALVAVATIVKPDTILRWKLVARKFNGQIKRKTPGRPPVSREVEALILKFAMENRNRGYDRIAGALKNLGHYVSDTAIANFLKRNGLPTAPERQKETTWKEFVHSHMDVLFAPISSQQKCGPASGSSPTTYSSSFISVQGESTSEESPP